MSDELKERLIKFREAVPTFSPGLPPRLPWVTNSNPPQPLWGCALFHAFIPNVAAERQRWAGGRYRFAVRSWRRSMLIHQPTQLDQPFLSLSDIKRVALRLPPHSKSQFSLHHDLRLLLFLIDRHIDHFG